MTNPTGVSPDGDSPNKIPLAGLTFDGVLLLPDASNVIPSGVDTSTQFIYELRLNIPVVSTAVNTVTEARMAVAMARQGGMGILHRNPSIEGQAQQVEIVKRPETDTVSDPVTCSPDDAIAEVDTKCARYRISGLPTADEGDRLVGICTNRDIRFEADLNRKTSEVMTPMPLVVAEQGVSGDAALNLLRAHEVEKLLIVDGEGRLTDLITVKDSVKKDRYPNASKDGSGRLLVGAGIGTGEDSWKRIHTLADADVDVLVVDTVHTHNSGVLEMVSRIRKEFGEDIQIIGGNLATCGTAQTMTDAGAGAIKIGVGPNSICTARIIADVDAPQITVITEASVATERVGALIIVDGGMQFPGDVAKAPVAGTPPVMPGPMLASTVEAPDEITFINGKQHEIYRGMGSPGAMQGRGLTGEKRSYSKGRYFRVDVEGGEKLASKGIEGRVPFHGSINSIVHRLIGGLRAAMGYTGSTTAEQLYDAQFVQITAVSLRGSHPHGIQITVEALDYYQR